MRQELIEAIKPHEERVELGGLTLIVRELACAADITAFQDNADMTYKLVVRSTFDEAGEPAFSDEDIPALKAGAKFALLPLINAVTRVNGFALKENIKNSAAAPGNG